jgi:hypothetical protein
VRSPRPENELLIINEVFESRFNYESHYCDRNPEGFLNDEKARTTHLILIFFSAE